MNKQSYPPKKDYVPVSAKMLTEYSSKLTAAEFKVFVTHYHYYKNEWPDIRGYIAHSSGCSRPTVNNAYKKFEKLGIMDKFKGNEFPKEPRKFQHSRLPLSVLQEQKGLACKVYAYIGLKIGIKGYDFASNRIAKELNKSKRAVDTALRELEGVGLLTRQKVKKSNRVTYNLFYDIRESLHDRCLKEEFDTGDLYWPYQTYLKRHNWHFRKGCEHKPLRNETIEEYCQKVNNLRHSEGLTHEKYTGLISAFLATPGRSSDYHFPVFLAYIRDSLRLEVFNYDGTVSDCY